MTSSENFILAPGLKMQVTREAPEIRVTSKVGMSLDKKSTDCRRSACRSPLNDAHLSTLLFGRSLAGLDRATGWFTGSEAHPAFPDDVKLLARAAKAVTILDSLTFY